MERSGLLASYVNVPIVASDPNEINILLVEDCQTDSELFKHLLGTTNLNANVTTVETIREARVLLEEGGYMTVFS